MSLLSSLLLFHILTSLQNKMCVRPTYNFTLRNFYEDLIGHKVIIISYYDNLIK